MAVPSENGTPEPAGWVGLAFHLRAFVSPWCGCRVWDQPLLTELNLQDFAECKGLLSQGWSTVAAAFSSRCKDRWLDPVCRTSSGVCSIHLKLAGLLQPLRFMRFMCVSLHAWVSLLASLIKFCPDNITQVDRTGGSRDMRHRDSMLYKLLKYDKLNCMQ